MLAAEDAYARARASLEAAQAVAQRGRQPAVERHYACGHAGMVRTERDDGVILNLCPACQDQLATGSAFYTPIRSLLIPVSSPMPPATESPTAPRRGRT